MKTGNEWFLSLKAEIIKKYYSYFTLFSAYYRTKDTSDTIFISLTALNDAADECLKDIQFMINRRNARILTKGKVAGAITYRLSRTPIIHSGNPLLLEDRIFLKMQSILAVAVGMSYMNIPFTGIDEKPQIEILYSLIKRHVNQETLGLVFDIMKGNNV